MAASDLEAGVAGSEFLAAKPDVDLSHHLSESARARVNSPLKDLLKYVAIPNTVMMGGGFPSPDYFPWESISAEAMVPHAYPISTDSERSSASMLGWLWNLFQPSIPTKTLTVPKYQLDPKKPQLATALQYGTALGLPALQSFLIEFTKTVFQPPNPKTEIFIHAGSTDAWTKCLQNFCNPGEIIITEEWTYTSALAAALPYGVKPVGIPMDGQGMRADALEDVLANWDADVRGAARPHLMYTIPHGQNPCGTTMGAVRKQAVYDVCVKYDVIIVEDDPYYFMQVGEYLAPEFRSMETGDDSEKDFLGSLVPSFLKFDVDGRVIRLDTFSKTIAPGSRLGWYTCNPLFKERFERATETSTQAPCGYSQALITQLLTEQWKYTGWIRWLRGTRAQYKMRRDFTIDTIRKLFDLQEEFDDSTRFAPLNGSVKLMVGRSKRRCSGEKRSKILFSFVAPTSGMFLWLKLHLYNHPAYNADAPSPKTPLETLEFRIWEDLALNGLLLGPGWVFGTDPDSTLVPEAIEASTRTVSGKYAALSEGGKHGHLRLSYSMTSLEDIERGVGQLTKVLDKQFFSS